MLAVLAVVVKPVIPHVIARDFKLKVLNSTKLWFLFIQGFLYKLLCKGKLTNARGLV